MMDSITINIKGADNILAMLKALPRETVTKHYSPVKKALLKAGRVIQAEAKLNIKKIIAEPNLGGQAYESTGLLEKSVIVSRSRMNAGENGEKYIVRVKPGKRVKYAQTKANIRQRRAGKFYNLPSPAFYGAFLEYGTSKMRPHPWLRPAVHAKAETAINVAIEFLANEIEKIANKLGKGQNVS